MKKTVSKSIPATAYKKHIVRDAIKQVASKCKANFEIPMSAITYIEYGNRVRKKPVKASYNYVQNVMYDMIKNKEI